jgi:hypothetical protein
MEADVNRTVCTSLVAVIAVAGALAAGQGRNADDILGGARAALGGDKLAAVRTLTAVGHTLRANPNGTSTESEFEMALELPDRYRMRSVMVSMGNMTVYRHTGFNGNQVIEEIDRPPNLSGGNVVIRIQGPGGAAVDPEKMTAEQKAEFNHRRLLANQKEFGKLALGLFAASPAAYPLTFRDGGQAESADGKADVLDVSGEGGFAAKLFIDAQTHLPLMLSWMDKEPLVIQMGSGGPMTAGGGSGTTTVTRIGGTAQGGQPATPPSMTPEEREKLMRDVEAKRKEAEATLRTVEYRVFYGDYKSVGGVQLPHRIQRSIDGKPTEEMIVESFKVNPKIDAKTFQASK